MADRNEAVAMSLEEAKILVMRGMAGQSPRINPTNNHWEVYDNESGAWKDTGVDASGNVDITGDNQLVFLNYDGNTMRITVAETGEPITAAQIGALTSQGKMAFLYADINVPEWLAFNGWYPNTGEAVFDNDKFHVVVTTNLQTLVTTGELSVKPWLPEVTPADAGKVLKVNSGGAWAASDAPSELPSLDPGGEDANKLLGVDEQGEEYKLVNRPTGVPNYSSAPLGSVLKLYRPSANSGNAMTWGPPGYQIPVSLNAGVYTIASGVTAEGIVANKNNLVIIVNGSLEYNCVGAMTSDFGYGHFYFLLAKPSNSKIETEWLDLVFYTGDANVEASVSVTPFQFDIQKTTYINVSFNGNTYSTDKTAAQIVAALPNAAAWLGEAKYSPAGWNLEDGYLVDATFIRGIRTNSGAAALDCIRFVNDGGVTVERFTLTPGAYRIPVSYNNGAYITTATGRDVYDHLDNCFIFYNGLFYHSVGANISGPYGWAYFACENPSVSGKIENSIFAVHLLGDLDVCEITQYTKDILLLPSVSAADNGKVLKVVNGVWTAVAE